MSMKNDIQKQETRQGLIALNQALTFLNHRNAHVELGVKTMIGQKYIVTCDNERKEIDLTYGNTVITSFRDDKFTNRDVVYHEGVEISHKVHVLRTMLEKEVSNKNVVTKIGYYWHQLKKQIKR